MVFAENTSAQRKCLGANRGDLTRLAPTVRMMLFDGATTVIFIADGADANDTFVNAMYPGQTVESQSTSCCSFTSDKLPVGDNQSMSPKCFGNFHCGSLF